MKANGDLDMDSPYDHIWKIKSKTLKSSPSREEISRVGSKRTNVILNITNPEPAALSFHWSAETGPTYKTSSLQLPSFQEAFQLYSRFALHRQLRCDYATTKILPGTPVSLKARLEAVPIFPLPDVVAVPNQHPFRGVRIRQVATLPEVSVPTVYTLALPIVNRTKVLWNSR